MKEELKKLYNEKRNLEVKLNSLLQVSFKKEGRKWKEKMYRPTIEMREELEKVKKKIEFIENLSLEMETNEMFYSKKKS